MAALGQLPPNTKPKFSRKYGVKSSKREKVKKGCMKYMFQRFETPLHDQSEMKNVGSIQKVMISLYLLQNIR